MGPEELSRLIGTRMPREWLGEFPTPVIMAQPLSDEVGAKIHVKRDDLSSGHYGGNKVRKLEFALADAKAEGAKTVLTFGGVGSHHAVATTVHARGVGLNCAVVVVDQPLTQDVRKSLLLCTHFGTRLYYRGSYAKAAMAIPRLLRQIRQCDGVPGYLLVPGASSPVGCVGYALAAMELRRQIDDGETPEPDTLFLAAGSCGTLAGLLAGAALLGWDIPIRAVRVVDRYLVNDFFIKTLARATLRRIRKDVPELFSRGMPALPRFELLHGYFGGGYGAPTPEGAAAVETARQRAGLVLEGTYTGKTFAALLDHAAANPDSNILFWNTHSSVDFSKELEAADWRGLPRELWKYFDGTLKLPG